MAGHRVSAFAPWWVARDRAEKEEAGRAAGGVSGLAGSQPSPWESHSCPQLSELFWGERHVKKVNKTDDGVNFKKKVD